MRCQPIWCIIGLACFCRGRLRLSMNPPQTEEQRFLKFVTEHKPKMLKICRVFAWPREDQDELLRDILSRLWRAWPGFSETVPAEIWVYRVALNTAIASARKIHAAVKRKPASNLVPDALPAVGVANAKRGDEVTRLYQAVSRLSLLDKAVVTLHLENLSYGAIGSVMGLAPGNVGIAVHRARSALTRHLRENQL